MRKHIYSVIALLLLTYSLRAQNDTTDIKWFNHIKIGALAGFKAYGIEKGYRQLKDDVLSRVYFAEINVLDAQEYGKHGLYFEFIHQPMLTLIPHEDLSLVYGFFRNQTYYEAFVRSTGFNLGYNFSYEVFSNWEIGTKIGFGKTYFELREYITPQSTMITETYNTKDTMTNFQISLHTNYTLRNNFGLYAEAALAIKIPVFKLGFTYLIPSK